MVVENFDKEWIAIYEKYRKLLISYAQTFVAKEEAEDIVHDLFTYLLENKEIIKTIKSPCAYLRQWVRNSCLNFTKAVDKKRSQSINDNDMFYEAEENDPFFKLMTMEKKNAIENAINILPKDCREVVKLWLDGFRYKEISEKLGISENTVDTHIKRGKSKMQTALSFFRE